MTTRCIELMGKKDFVAIALNPEHETFVVYVVSLSAAFSSSTLKDADVYPLRKPQISDLIAKKALTKVPAEYLDFANVFSPDLASKLPEYTGINKHTIKLIEDQQPSITLFIAYDW